MKPDETRFLKDIYLKKDIPISEGTRCICPRDIINEPGFYMHHKRA